MFQKNIFNPVVNPNKNIQKLKGVPPWIQVKLPLSLGSQVWAQHRADSPDSPELWARPHEKMQMQLGKDQLWLSLPTLA